MDKEQLHQWCVNLVEKQREELVHQLKSLQEDAASDGKSTAGDKHETSRAMVHLEQEQLGKQLLEMNQRLEALHHMKTNLGALYHTDLGDFYVSVSLGKIKYKEHMVTVISAQSPIAKQLSTLHVGDEFLMGPNRGKILQKV
jgi:ABC-type phosphate transport system auxiliary subunit